MSEISLAENAVVFENVKFSYPGSEGVFAVNGVSLFVKKGETAPVNLTVKRGEFLSVIGHNGSGKSTLARLTNGLLEPDAGKITVLGLNVSEGKNSLEVRKHVGIVFQNPDNQTVASIVEDDVAFGPENIGVEREEIGRRIDWALRAVGMEEFRHSTPTRLSGGQKQRIAIAGVLAVKPEILILDESTAMLDPKGRREVIEVVKRLNKEEGITVILITHFMEEALLADRTVVMNRGEIVLEGAPEEIFESGYKLEAYNLCLPRITEIINVLNSAGMNLKNVLRPEELSADILRSFKDKGITNAKSSPAEEKKISSSREWDIDVKNLSFTYSKKSPFATKA